ncbi:unnamed protein product [Sphagnum jensenii]|uniref:tRNA/rRNA methyltransferase SpoU type domain-containing protein n=1 Tax=Sphagnum jensenii TaxID=128206 RepID=A0ABP0VTE4_9BRYO
MLQRPVGCWRCGWRLGRRVPAWAGDGARSCHELQAQIGARKEEMEKKEEMEEKQEMGCKRSLLGRVRVVLVSPQQAGNIGSVCRVTTNFECNDLWLVNPQCNYKGEEAQVMAANAASRSKLEQVHVSESLSAALKGCSMAVGFTRRSGGLRLPDIHLSNLKIPSLGDLNLALIFGREDRGLTNMELLQCTHVCSIPSGKGTGSLNLSHAVAVALSRLYEAAHQEKAEDCAVYLPQTSMAYKNLPGTASIEEVDNLIRRWEQMLLACNKLTVLVDEPNYRMQERMLIHMRRMMMRAGPSLREVGFLHGFLTTVNTITSSIASSQLKRQPRNTSQSNP